MVLDDAEYSSYAKWYRQQSRFATTSWDVQSCNRYLSTRSATCIVLCNETAMTDTSGPWKMKLIIPEIPSPDAGT